MKRVRTYFSVFARAPLSTLTAIITLAGSLSVAFLIHGNPLASLNSQEILSYGAADGSTLLINKEIWRIISAQFLHQKQGHMILNVILCWYLGFTTEIALGKYNL